MCVFFLCVFFFFFWGGGGGGRDGQTNSFIHKASFIFLSHFYCVFSLLILSELNELHCNLSFGKSPCHYFKYVNTHLNQDVNNQPLT